jgi:hypothetical protein
LCNCSTTLPGHATTTPSSSALTSSASPTTTITSTATTAPAGTFSTAPRTSARRSATPTRLFYSAIPTTPRSAPQTTPRWTDLATPTASLPRTIGKQRRISPSISGCATRCTRRSVRSMAIRPTSSPIGRALEPTARPLSAERWLFPTRRRSIMLRRSSH